MVSSDDFCNADVRYEQSFANIRSSLTRSNGGPSEIPIVTGFLARGENTGRYPCCSLPGLSVHACVHGVGSWAWPQSYAKVCQVFVLYSTAVLQAFTGTGL